MKYKQITVKVNNDETDLASLAFIEEGSEGVSVIDGNEICDMLMSGDKSWDYYNEELLNQDRESAIIMGAFECDYNELKLEQAISSYIGRQVELIVSVHDYLDWSSEWQKYYKPLHYDNVVILSPWQKKDFSGKKSVVIDPNMAFGTGNHETTSMCITLLNDIDLHGKQVLDIGCGSGILGLVALVLGANDCVFVDNDQDAVRATEANIKLNGLGNKNVLNGDLLAKTTTMSDIIVANITADALILLSNDIKSAILPHGQIILSGIISNRKNDVLNAYSTGYKLLKEINQGEWCALLLESC